MTARKNVICKKKLPGGGALCGEKTITVFPIVVVKSKNPYTVCVTKFGWTCVG